MHDLDRENRSRLKPSLEQRLPAQRAPAKAMKFGVCFALVHIKVLWILRDEDSAESDDRRDNEGSVSSDSSSDNSVDIRLRFVCGSKRYQLATPAGTLSNPRNSCQDRHK